MLIDKLIESFWNQDRCSEKVDEFFVVDGKGIWEVSVHIDLGNHYFLTVYQLNKVIFLCFDLVSAEHFLHH